MTNMKPPIPLNLVACVARVKLQKRKTNGRDGNKYGEVTVFESPPSLSACLQGILVHFLAASCHFFTCANLAFSKHYR